MEVDSEFIRGATKAFMERYNLSFVEADGWARYQRVTWQAHESDYLAGQIGQLDDLIAIQLTFPDQALYWKAEQDSFEQSFVDYVNQLAPDTSQSWTTVSARNLPVERGPLTFNQNRLQSHRNGRNLGSIPRI